MHSVYASLTRTRELHLHSILERTSWQTKWLLSTTALMYIPAVFIRHLQQKLQTRDIEIVAAEAFTEDSKTDFSVQLQKAKEAGAELVFLPIYYTEASIILTQANTMGFDPMFFGCDGMDGILGVENFDTSLAEDLMLLTPFVADAQDEKTQAFVSAYEEKFNDTPNQFAADTYDAMLHHQRSCRKSWCYSGYERI